MADRFAIPGIVSSTVLVAAAYASAFLPGGAPVWAPWLLAFGTAGGMVGMMVLGAQRNGRIGKLAWPFALVFVIVAGGFAVLLSLPAPEPGAPLYGGLPLGAAVLLFGIGLLPFFVVPIAYALTFDELTLSEADMVRVRAMAASRAAMASPAGRRDPEPGAPPSVLDSYGAGAEAHR